MAVDEIFMNWEGCVKRWGFRGQGICIHLFMYSFIYSPPVSLVYWLLQIIFNYLHQALERMGNKGGSLHRPATEQDQQVFNLGIRAGFGQVVSYLVGPLLTIWGEKNKQYPERGKSLENHRVIRHHGWPKLCPTSWCDLLPWPICSGKGCGGTAG